MSRGYLILGGDYLRRCDNIHPNTDRGGSMVSAIEAAIIALIPVVSSVIGTAVYYNRKKTNKLYQRLFGLNEDEIDTGYIIEMTNDMDNIEGKIDELNHKRIQNLEVQMEALQNEVERISERLTEEERSDD